MIKSRYKDANSFRRSLIPFCFTLKVTPIISKYSHLFNKRGGGAKVAKSLNVEVGINVEGGIFLTKLVHNSNKRGVEGGKI